MTASEVTGFASRGEPEKGAELLQLAGFALIVLLPAILANFPLQPHESEHQALYSIIGSVQALLDSIRFGLVAAFFLSRLGLQEWGDVASPRIAWYKQVLVGIGLWFSYYIFFDFWAIVANLLAIRNPSIAWLHPITGEETGLNAVFSVVNGFSEELMRVYLLVQLQRVGLRPIGAAIAAAAAMASYHYYQGGFFLIAFFIAHVFLNRLYLSKRPLLAMIVWHMLSDCMHSTDLAGVGIVSAALNLLLLNAVGALTKMLGR